MFSMKVPGCAGVAMISHTNKRITVKSRISDGEDDYGVKKYIYIEREMDALVAWGSTGMDFGVDRNIMTTQATIYLTKDNAITNFSEVFIDGKKYIQDGEYITWDAPSNFNITTGQVVTVKRVDG